MKRILLSFLENKISVFYVNLGIFVYLIMVFFFTIIKLLKMNRLIFALVLFYGTFFFAQNKVSLADTIQVKKNYFKIHCDDMSLIKNTFDFRSIGVNRTQLSVYNSFTKYNDVYFLQNDNYYYSNPRLLLENNWRSSKIDSFNPYGAPNLGSAIVLGLITVLFEK